MSMTQSQSRPLSSVNRRETIRNYIFLTVGALIMMVNFNVFMAPSNIAPGGVGGLSLILNHYTGIPRGTGMLLLSIPLIALGFWKLGRFRFLVRTLYVTVFYTIGVDITARLLPAGGLVDDLLLTAVFGGVLGGVGYGLVLRAGAWSAARASSAACCNCAPASPSASSTWSSMAWSSSPWA